MELLQTENVGALGSTTDSTSLLGHKVFHFGLDSMAIDSGTMEQNEGIDEHLCAAPQDMPPGNNVESLDHSDDPTVIFRKSEVAGDGDWRR
ncbi:hypothetical protein L6452_36017 [Arctium lappa]|uniref:Uncharacterized protein n=1 Tax=Arctium lappa TaxID=4217 RepID=A0ACB8Y7E8_ARCLA|nr:hypothetical protein L6452_36017 [Arctium lappa]